MIAAAGKKTDVNTAFPFHGNIPGFMKNRLANILIQIVTSAELPKQAPKRLTCLQSGPVP